MRGAKEPLIDGLGPVAAIVIIALGTALSFLVAQDLRQRQHAELRDGSAQYAAALENVIEHDVNALYQALHGRSEYWASIFPEGDVTSAERWESSAKLFLREHEGLLALARGRADAWQIVGSAEGEKLLREAMPIARQREAPADEFASGPFVLGDGKQQVIALQVRAAEEPTAERVFAIYEPARALAEALDQRALGFAVSVTAGDEILYRRAGEEPALPDLAHTASLAFSMGRPWTLRVAPGSEAVARVIDMAPRIALIAGLLGSALISAVVHFGNLSWRRARALRLSNADLLRQVNETRRGEGELKLLSEELERRVEQRTNELNETIVELETFNYSVSHDLRGPLGAVVNFAAILAEDYGDRIDGTGREHLQRIVNSASSAVAMMDALLAYSRSGRDEMSKAWIDMGLLVRVVSAEVTAASPSLACGIKIGDLPDAYADENMMRFVVSNLISNACKFRKPDEEPRVEVSGHSANGEVVYSVRDEGVGFDMRYTDKLFRVFERLHPLGDYEGHGVGLAIVARMVRRHGGRVWAQGAEGKGATFYFSVPTPEVG